MGSLTASVTSNYQGRAQTNQLSVHFNWDTNDPPQAKGIIVLLLSLSPPQSPFLFPGTTFLSSPHPFLSSLNGKDCAEGLSHQLERRPRALRSRGGEAVEGRACAEGARCRPSLRRRESPSSGRRGAYERASRAGETESVWEGGRVLACAPEKEGGRGRARARTVPLGGVRGGRGSHARV